MSEYRTLTRGELRGFNKEAQELILAAMWLGATARISNKGHCIIRAPKGGATMSVAKQPSLNNRGIQNQNAHFRRLFGMDAADVEKKRAAATGDSDEVIVLPEAERPRVPVTCPANGCKATFVTEGARYSHIEKEHSKCPRPDCDWVGSTSRGALATHMRLAHEDGVKPWEVSVSARRARAEERRAATERRRQGAEDKIAAIRDILGEDADVETLRKELATTKEALESALHELEETRAKFKLLKEALEL